MNEAGSVVCYVMLHNDGSPLIIANQRMLVFDHFEFLVYNKSAYSELRPNGQDGADTNTPKPPLV